MAGRLRSEPGEAQRFHDPRTEDVQPADSHGLSAHPRSKRHRRRAHRHTRLLAREDHGGRARGRQGRLRREAGGQHRRAHQRDARCVQNIEADHPDRHRAAQLGSLHRSEEDHRQWRARQHPPRGHRPAGQLRQRTSGPGANSGRPGLEHVAAPEDAAGRIGSAVLAEPARVPRLVPSTEAGSSATGAPTTSTSRTGS